MREDVISDAVGKISSVVLELLSRGDVPTPDALRLLLRAYAATGRDDFRNALELGLARAVEIAGDSSSESAAPWLVLIGEASDASDDERLRMSASNLAFKAKMVWGATRSIGLSAASVDACLRAKLEVRDAVDELERLIGRSYEPGDGVGGSLEDEMAVAGALLTAFLVTGRLPYAMLAEELVQHTRRAHLGRTDIAFAPACETASVLARMAALHHDDDYRAAAVISPAARYHEDAAVILERLAGDAPGRGLAAAAYALAAGELQSAIS